MGENEVAPFRKRESDRTSKIGSETSHIEIVDEEIHETDFN